MKNVQVARLLAYVTGMVNRQLLLQNEYLIAGNRILRSHVPARVPLTDPQRATLAEIGKRLGRQPLEPVASVAKPDTILGWYRKLIARKFDGSKHRAYPGRPPVGREITELIVRMARENSDGDTIASPAPYRISAIASPIRPSAISCAGSVSLLLPSAASK
jgi:putative transposase